MGINVISCALPTFALILSLLFLSSYLPFFNGLELTVIKGVGQPIPHLHELSALDL